MERLCSDSPANSLSIPCRASWPRSQAKSRSSHDNSLCLLLAALPTVGLFNDRLVLGAWALLHVQLSWCANLMPDMLKKEACGEGECV